MAPLTDDQRAAIRDGIRHREATHERRGTRALNRVEITVTEGLEYVASNASEPGDPMAIGEPVDRGGTGHGTSPLSHFLAGAGGCLLNQFVRIAIADDLPVTFQRMAVRGEFRRDAGSGFQRIVSEVHGTGDLTDDDAQALTAHAEELCYVHCTLRMAIEMTTILVLDGRERVRHTSGPGIVPG
jgi:uncharacterized OsmC-like protein